MTVRKKVLNMSADYNKIMSVIDQQEKLLRIDHFSSEFALNLEV